MTQNNPSHAENLPRLNRISGQIDGIKKMIEEERYCIDIINQIRAARAALKALEINILNKHIMHCVAHSLGSSPEAVQKAEELKNLFSRIDD